MTFSVTCPSCGGDLTHTNGAQPSSREVKAVCWCEHCHSDWLIIVAMQSVRTDYGGQPPCGTNSGYLRHVRTGTPIDEACRDAHALYISVHGAEAALRKKATGREPSKEQRRALARMAGR